MNVRPIARSKNIVVQETNEEVLVYDSVENKAICLNETSALVWNLCNGKRSVAEIRESVSKHFGKPVDMNLILLALKQLKKQGLLDNCDEFHSAFEELTRREVVKKIGMGSMIALPLVSAIVAPQASFAQSCVGAGTDAPGTLVTNVCSNFDSACQALGGSNCCSGMSRSTNPAQPCPIDPMSPSAACECFG